MKELETLISVLERDLEIFSTIPEIRNKKALLSIQEQMKEEIAILRESIEIYEKYKSNLIEGGLI